MDGGSVGIVDGNVELWHGDQVFSLGWAVKVKSRKRTSVRTRKKQPQMGAGRPCSRGCSQPHRITYYSQNGWALGTVTKTKT